MAAGLPHTATCWRDLRTAIAAMFVVVSALYGVAEAHAPEDASNFQGLFACAEGTEVGHPTSVASLQRMVRSASLAKGELVAPRPFSAWLPFQLAFLVCIPAADCVRRPPAPLHRDGLRPYVVEGAGRSDSSCHLFARGAAETYRLRASN